MSDDKQDALSHSSSDLQVGPLAPDSSGEASSLALPDVHFHEIPPTPNYRTTLERAQATSRVKTHLPKLFNPFFRSQGTVNSLIIDALNQVGGFVKTLAEEIQTRDKLLETMVAHFNRQSQSSDSRLVQVDQQVGQMQDAVTLLREHTQSSDSRLSELGDQAHSRIAGLVSALRANDTRLDRVEDEAREAAPAVREQLESLRLELEETRARNHQAVESALELADRRVADSDRRHSQLTEEIQQRFGALEQALDTLATKQEMANVTQSLDEGLARLQDWTGQFGDYRTESDLIRVRYQEASDEQIRRIERIESRDQAKSIEQAHRADKVENDLVQMQGTISRLADDLARSGQSLEQLKSDLNQRLGETRTDLENLASRTTSDLEAVKQGYAPYFSKLAEIVASSKSMEAELNRVRSEAAALATRTAGLESDLTVRAEQQDQQVLDQQRTVEKVSEEITWARQEIALRRAEESTFIQETEKILRKKIAPRDDGGTAADRVREKLQAKNRRVIDSFYTAFEDRFRGSREEVKDKTRLYLGHIRRTIDDLGLAPSEFRLVDIGCGRGEWLELLRDEGIEAQGVDTNRAMIKTCKSFHLSVTEGDGLAFLKKQRPRSFTGISAFHVIEHLPLEAILDFFNLAQRGLKPGGILILETPNPENFRVGAYTFNFDATHCKPVPPELMRFYGEQSGLEPIETIKLNPYAEIPGTDKSPDSFLARLFDGALDYGTIFRKRS